MSGDQEDDHCADRDGREVREEQQEGSRSREMLATWRANRMPRRGRQRRHQCRGDTTPTITPVEPVRDKGKSPGEAANQPYKQVEDVG